MDTLQGAQQWGGLIIGERVGLINECCSLIQCDLFTTVFIFRNWLYENNVKIGFPTYLSFFHQDMPFKRNVKLHVRLFELLSGGNS